MKIETDRIPQISVIVPIYNMEKQMKKCLDSILAQTFEDYECLLIDDGSTDGSSSICDEYADKDSRFTAFHKLNGGLSDARNYGIDRAKGEYTIFFDPDDWIEKDCLKEMYNEAIRQEADMLVCDYFKNSDNGEEYIIQKPSSRNHWDVLEDILSSNIYGFCWNKLIKIDAYRKYGINYPTNIYGCEDQFCMCEMLMEDIAVGYLPKAFYHYVTVADSLSRHYDEHTYEMDKAARTMFVDLLKNTPYKCLAFDRKTSYIVGRAFMFGYKWFSSKRFLDEFKEYEELIFSIPRSRVYNFFYWLSFRGHYRFSRSLFEFFFSIKQMMKNFL